MVPRNLKLPVSLRDDLKTPMGKLIRGDPVSTVPLLKTELNNRKGILVGVGDVTVELLVTNGFSPEIIITDGYTKREKLIEWKNYPGYDEIKTSSPAAEITKTSWEAIQKTISLTKFKSTKIHIKVHGEEDLMVLPLILELPNNSVIVYGQPNEGAVIRIVTDESRIHALEIIEKMEPVE